MPKDNKIEWKEKFVLSRKLSIVIGRERKEKEPL